MSPSRYVGVLGNVKLVREELRCSESIFVRVDLGKREMERREHWEAVFATRAPQEMSWFQSSSKHSLELIERARIGARDGIIDVGGGCSSLIDQLLEYGYQDLSVLEISAKALEISRARLGLRAERISWIEADVTQFRAQRRFKLWHDRAVFHFMLQESEQRAYLKALRGALEVGGQLILAAFSPEGPKRCSGLEIRPYDEARIKETLGGEFELLESQREQHLTPAGKIQEFNYFRFLRRAEPMGFPNRGSAP